MAWRLIKQEILYSCSNASLSTRTKLLILCCRPFWEISFNRSFNLVVELNRPVVLYETYSSSYFNAVLVLISTIKIYDGVSKRFRTESITKYTLAFGVAH
jgi:hypothetical protein